MASLFESLLEEALEEGIMKVQHSRPHQKKKLRIFKRPQAHKVKRKKVTMHLKTNNKHRGFQYGKDGHLHKVIHRKAWKQ